MKINFIIFYKNDNCIRKCISCLNQLIVPEGVETDVLTVNEGNSISAAYEMAMRESEADFKVYIRENTYLLNRNFIIDILSFFDKNAAVSIAGVVGGNETGKFVEWIYGGINICNEDRTTAFNRTTTDSHTCSTVLGNLIVTREDTSWDGLENETFDIEYCKRAITSGKKIGVFDQNEPWCLWEYGYAWEERADVFTEMNEGWAYIGEKPLVSVLMASYNSEEIISQSIESIVNQTYRNLEIIIVDDCSTDSTQEIIRKYEKSDNRIKAIFLKKNNHVCNALNQGRKIASGKYLAHIGHDDCWVKTKIEEQVSLLERKNNIDVCFTWAHIIDDKNVICDSTDAFFRLFQHVNRNSEEWLRQLFIHGNCLCCPSALLRANKTPLKLYSLDTVQLQDYELWMYMLTKGEIYILQENLTFYRHFVKGRKNLSELGGENSPQTIRCSNEMSNIRYRLLCKLSDELFIKTFSTMFVYANAKSEKELLCEKFFLLYAVRSRHYMDVFYNISNDEESLNILYSKYNFSLPNYYDMETHLFF